MRARAVLVGVAMPSHFYNCLGLPLHHSVMIGLDSYSFDALHGRAPMSSTGASFVFRCAPTSAREAGDGVLCQ